MNYIGVDCGVHTGIAVWDATRKKLLYCRTLHLHEALTEVRLRAATEDCIVIFEDARQRKWIPQEQSISQYRGRLMGAGSVKRDAVIWEEFCTDLNIPFEAVAPRKGLTKWGCDTFCQVTGWNGRTSNHARDAAMLVFGRPDKH